ncbi:MAG: DUF4236 domain-containing protein [Desulfosporosinus sp.]|nr:DUF4236 domain-containing protein [Desulfosporosinus sp.]
MGFRYRKSIKIGPFQLDFSKKGVRVSVGGKKTRVGGGPRGVKNTLSVPDTGISYVKESRLKGTPTISKASRGQSARQKTQRRQIVRTKILRPYKGTRWLVGAFAGVVMLTGTSPGLGILVAIICGCRYYMIRERLKQQSVVSKVKVI